MRVHNPLMLPFALGSKPRLSLYNCRPTSAPPHLQELAAQPNAGGAAYRQLLAAAFLPAARCAMALPPPPGAAATAKCAAPELMEGMARELGAASAAAADAAAAQLPDIDEDAEG